MLKRLREWIPDINISQRAVVVWALASGLVFLGLTIWFLSVSTRTALLNDDLDKLTLQNNQLVDEQNKLWTEIGSVTAQQNMEQRAREAGFRPPDKTLYLVTPVPTTFVIEITGTVGITP